VTFEKFGFGAKDSFGGGSMGDGYDRGAKVSSFEEGTVLCTENVF
jgi:hypothetical protein